MKKIFQKYRKGFWAAGGGFPTIPVTPTWITSEMCGIADWMFYFLIILSVIMIVVAAYMYLTSNGDPEKVGKATKSITYAAVGIAVAILAKAIPVLIGNILGGSVPTCGSIESISSVVKY